MTMIDNSNDFKKFRGFFQWLGYGDWQLELLAWTGLFLSLLLVLGIVNSTLLLAALWCAKSIVGV